MLGYIVRRVLWIIPVLFFVSVITFILMQLAPGGPWDREKRLPPWAIAALDEKYGLNDPVEIQYLRWAGVLYFFPPEDKENPVPDACVERRADQSPCGLLEGYLGVSYKYVDREVLSIVGDGVWVTVQLGLQAFALSVLVGIPLGVIAALRHNGVADYVATFVSVIGIATPSFVLAILLMVIFAVGLHWLPTVGWEEPANWVMPTVALAGFSIAQVARYTRASMLEVTRRDYIRTAHSKGLKERTVVVVHMIRNALIPVITILGPILAFMVTGSFIIETIFSVPGIGRFYVTSIAQRDYGVIMAMTMLYAVVIAVLNLVVDVLYAYIDPRIRYS